MGRATKSAPAVGVEKQLADALALVNQLAGQNALLAAQVGARQGAPVYSGQLVVGIRNVSNYTVSLNDMSTGTLITHVLHPEHANRVDPLTRAVVSYVFWQQLRTGKQVGQGLIVRDDGLLGASDNVGPVDRPQDMHPDAVFNVVENPRTWVMEKSEEELRAAIRQMTSEPSLRRLQVAVDQEIWDIGEAKYAGNDDRPRLAIRDLPGQFRILDELAADRLDELNPVAAHRADEMTLRPRNGARR